MKACCFFGHRDCPESILPALRAAVEHAILQEGIETFYVGHEGNFDALAAKVMLEMTVKYPNIKFFVVLAYHPRAPLGGELQKHTVLADGVENVPYRLAILYRNEWMLARSQTVISCVTRSFGGAAAFLKKARAGGKSVVNIGV